MWTHTGEKPHKCDVCPYSTAHKKSLVNHMRTHTGEKPHKCDVCPYSTAHKKNLVNHMRTHKEEKPHKCDVCPYSTVYRSNLLCHMWTHTEENAEHNMMTEKKHSHNNDTEKCNVKVNRITNKRFDPEKPVNVNAHLNSDEDIEKGNLLTLQIKEESQDDGVQRWKVIDSVLKPETDSLSIYIHH